MSNSNSNSHYRRPSLLWPLLLIGLGMLLLLQNFNLLPPGTWAALVQLWPVLIILLGLDMLIGRRSAAGAALVLLLGALLVAGSLTWAALSASAQPAISQSIIQPSQEVERASVRLGFKVGELNVSALGPSNYLMEGQVTQGTSESLRQRYSVRGDIGNLTLDQQQSAVFVPFLGARGAGARWDVRLTPRLPLTLTVDTGVGKTMLDLSELNLTTLNLETGVGQTFVTFPANRAVRASVRAGVGEVTLAIPADLPTRITVSSGLTQIRIPERFARAGDVYTTPGFSTEGPHLDLELSAGLGNVTVK